MNCNKNVNWALFREREKKNHNKNRKYITKNSEIWSLLLTIMIMKMIMIIM